MDKFEEIKTLTKYEMIRLLANFTTNLDNCFQCPFQVYCNTSICEVTISLWLDSPAGIKNKE